MALYKEIKEGWKVANVPAEEKTRLKHLHNYRILDSSPEKKFDDITCLVSQLLDVPVVLVSLVDENRQWFKSCYGMDAKETPRDQAFCAHAILSNDVLDIPNARIDERFKNNPLVAKEPYIRSYAGCPLITKNNQKIGTLCAIGFSPRKKLSPEHQNILKVFASIVIDEIELRLLNLQAKEYITSLESIQKEVTEQFEREKMMHQQQNDSIVHVSHEIRSPIHSILHGLVLIKKFRMDKKFFKYFEMTNNIVAHISELVNKILDAAKVDENSMILENIDVDIMDLCESVVEMTDLKTESNIEICFECANNVPKKICVDPTKLKQVLINLLNNAVKFTKKGSVILKLSENKKDKNNTHLKFEVIDTGIGIAKEKQQQIFKRFEQAELSTSRKYGGTGLGLHISKEIVELMGGELSVSSEEGKGSCFYFTIPCKVVD